MANKGFVCYCPELKLYHYYNEDTSNAEEKFSYKFDEDELITAIATYMANDKNDQAESMSKLTSLARLHPHQFVIFDTNTEELRLVEPDKFFKSQEKG